MKTLNSMAIALICVLLACAGPAIACGQWAQDQAQEWVDAQGEDPGYPSSLTSDSESDHSATKISPATWPCNHGGVIVNKPTWYETLSGTLHCFDSVTFGDNGDGTWEYCILRLCDFFGECKRYELNFETCEYELVETCDVSKLGTWIFCGSVPESQDSDEDGLTDIQELAGNPGTEPPKPPTDPFNPDTDGDGSSDADDTHPTDPLRRPTAISDGDPEYYQHLYTGAQGNYPVPGEQFGDPEDLLDEEHPCHWQVDWQWLQGSSDANSFETVVFGVVWGKTGYSESTGTYAAKQFHYAEAWAGSYSINRTKKESNWNILASKVGECGVGYVWSRVGSALQALGTRDIPLLATAGGSSRGATVRLADTDFTLDLEHSTGVSLTSAGNDGNFVLEGVNVTLVGASDSESQPSREYAVGDKPGANSASWQLKASADSQANAWIVGTLTWGHPKTTADASADSWFLLVQLRCEGAGCNHFVNLAWEHNSETGEFVFRYVDGNSAK